MSAIVHHLRSCILQTNNEQLKELLKKHEIAQIRAFELWNEGQARPLAISTWKAYLGDPTSARYRECPLYVLDRMKKVLETEK